jgi:hypothetical protein
VNARIVLFAWHFSLLAALPGLAAPFVVTVVDDQTGRGVPLVELTTVNHVRFITDSAGLAAVDEPGMMGQRFYFYVTGHGYEFPKDGFGFAGVALDVKPGGGATVKVKRLNIAQRLYRTTGEGIYRDTILAGRTPPTERPVLNAKVLGQDSTQRVLYKGKIHWFWGDTNQAAYPLGHFGMSGAVSDLPGSGGIGPDVGVNYRYFTDPKTGFARPMVPGQNLRWTEGHVVMKDPQGRERMIARCETLKSLTESLGRKLIVYNDDTEQFDDLAALGRDEPLCPVGHPIRHTDGGIVYVYFPFPWGTLRVKDDWQSVQTPALYEGFTCLTAGSRYAKGKSTIDRDAAGKVVWAWKPNTPPVTPAEQAELIKAKSMTADEAWNALRDADTGAAVQAHAGSVNWNAYRKKWILITTQLGGKSSHLGEIYYAEADAPHGPFGRARKIVTHDKYTFYNPVHHPFFDADGGRTIYFEGTYTNTFSGNDVPTPRYDYNPVMYKLDLSDPRLQ